MCLAKRAAFRCNFQNLLPMPENNYPPESEPAPFGRQRRWRMFSALGLTLLFLAIWLSPTYSFHPLCTYTVNARVTADVEIAGQKLSSTVVYQNSRSRGWISMINSAGCQQLYGDVLTFKLADDSVLIVPSQICHKGAEELERAGHVDILKACTGKQAHQDSAFRVDSATRPRKWYSATNGAVFRLNSFTAKISSKSPADDIASIAPNLLKSDFKYGHQQWSRSPEAIISFQRRYEERREKPDQHYEFEVRNERF